MKIPAYNWQEKYLKNLLDSSDREATDSSSDPWESVSMVAAPVEKDREAPFILLLPQNSLAQARTPSSSVEWKRITHSSHEVLQKSTSLRTCPRKRRDHCRVSLFFFPCYCETAMKVDAENVTQDIQVYTNFMKYGKLHEVDQKKKDKLPCRIPK